MLLRLLFFPFRYGFSKLKKAIGKLDTIKIEPLYAFGNESRIFVQGRVVESYKQSKPSARKSKFQNVLAAMRRYAGSSVPDVKVEVIYQDERKVLESDSEGIISCTFDQPKVESNHHDTLTLSLVPEENIEPERRQFSMHVHRYDSKHPRGIISDIDDTILISHATRVGRKFWLSISKNAYTRRPFPGISEFYKSLTNHGQHPVFYVSSSDWNLFDLIRDFLNFRNIPAGVILLKDLHIDLKNIWKSGGGGHQHKLSKIEMLLELYSGMQFILIGDSGQHDPEIYSEIIRDYPGRITAVYIREIKQMDDQRRKLLQAKIDTPDAPTIVFVKNTTEAMEHARNHSIISDE
jgi:phosphatidate phosphatase APP1